MTDCSVVLSAETYGIRPDYKARAFPEYFHDNLQDGAVWQCDVYRFAFALGSCLTKPPYFLDIGCGRGQKTQQWQVFVCGIDHDSNLLLSQNDFHAGNRQWIDHDLENGLPRRFLDDERTILICADVIEHLHDPDHLLRHLVHSMQYARAVIISTPDRLRLYGYDHDGEPANPHHAREWTLDELTGYLRALGANIRLTGYTRANDKRTDKTTMLIAGGIAKIDFKVIAEQCGIEVFEYAS